MGGVEYGSGPEGEESTERWNRFRDGIQALVTEVYGDDAPPLLLGAHFREGETGHRLRTICNIDEPCLAVSLADQIQRDYEELHTKHHLDNSPPVEWGEVSLDEALEDAPEEIKTLLRALKDAGLSTENIHVAHARPVDTSDLDGLPSTQEG